MSHIVRVAIVQDAPVAFNQRATLEKTTALLKQAANRRADLVVFPEAFLGGYPIGADFGVRVGMRSEQGRDWFARYAGAAFEQGSSALNELAATIRECQIHCVIGLIERCGGTLYCSVGTWNPAGELVGWRRKLMPTALERVIWGAGDGSTLKVAPTQIGRIGAVICWENYMPLLRATMYAQGVQLYCAPTVDDRPTWSSTVRHIALEGRCYVLSACQFAKRRDFPADYDCAKSDDPDNILIRGGSCVVGPLGEFLVEPLFDRAEILIADCDLDAIPRGQFDLDVNGHYARPDVFELRVNTKRQQAVHFEQDDL